MKKIITIVMLLLIVVACKKENNPITKFKNATKKVKKAKQSLNNVTELIKGAEGVQKNIQKLSEITPISKDQIKSWMPEELGDLKRTKYEIGKQMGFANISNVNLEFKDADNNKIVNVKVIDGAGNGATFISMFLLVKNADVDSEDQTGYERTEVFGKQKVLVKYSNPKYSHSSKLNYLINDRFLVEATGWSMEPDELWNYLKKLDIDNLSK
jgi:hypothetical protein